MGVRGVCPWRPAIQLEHFFLFHLLNRLLFLLQQKNVHFYKAFHMVCEATELRRGRFLVRMRKYGQMDIYWIRRKLWTLVYQWKKQLLLIRIPDNSQICGFLFRAWPSCTLSASFLPYISSRLAILEVMKVMVREWRLIPTCMCKRFRGQITP